MSGQTIVTIEPFGDLVEVHGLPDAAGIRAAAEALDTGSGRRALVVIDVRDAVLVPAGPVVELVAALRQRAEGRPMALLCDRLSGRRLLRARCRHLDVAVVDAIPTELLASKV